jgi:hypothetical protein
LGKLRVGLIFCSGGLDMQLDQTFADLSSDLKTLSKKVMRYFFDRSAVVGVRGEITAVYLRFLGFPDDQIAVIGCPSAYFPRFRKPLREAAPTLTADSPIALNQNYLAPELSSFNWRTLTEFPHSVYVGQILSDLQLLTGELPSQQVSPQQQFLFDHRVELGGRLKFPLSSFAWFEYLSTQAFVFGTRLHGCIPAILAGTPTLFPVWDTRSQEVTDYHGYPTISLRPGVDSPADWDIAELARRYNPAPYLRKFDAGFRAWLDFLRANDLPTIFDPATASSASSDADISAAAASASVTSANPRPTSAFEVLETAYSQYIERLERVNFPQVVEIDNPSRANII